MAIRREILTQNLPSPTKQYLFNLIIGGGAANAPSEFFTQNPDNVPGTTTKFASAAGLATGGAAAANGGGRGPGRFRLIRHIHRAPRKIVWIYAEHLGRSSYNFDRIVFPGCEGCGGTTEVLCPQCHGNNIRKQGTPHPHPLVNRPIGQDRRSCTKCNGQRVIDCTICKPQDGPPPIMLQGKSISRKFDKW